MKQSNDSGLSVTENMEKNIFTGFQNYDLGLPGSGILRSPHSISGTSVSLLGIINLLLI